MYTELVKRVSEMLKAELTEKNRFASMDLCQELMDAHDNTRDIAMRETLRSWVGKIQERFQ